MKKTFLLKNLGCANCAAKIERKIQKIDGVDYAAVNFLTTKLTIEGDENKWDYIMNECKKAVKKVESDVVISAF